MALPRLTTNYQRDRGYEQGQDSPLISWEFPRLCRGGSNSLTIPAVVPHGSTEETLNVSRQAHEGSSIDEWGPELTSVKSANAIRELFGLKKGIMHLGFRHDHAEYSRAGHTLRVRHCASGAAFRRLTSLGSRSAPNSRFERLTS